MTNLDSHAGDFQFNAGLFFTFLFMPIPATLRDHPVPIPIGGFDALLLANARRALLATHALGIGRRGRQGDGGHYGGGRKRIEYQSHVPFLLSAGYQRRKPASVHLVPSGRETTPS